MDTLTAARAQMEVSLAFHMVFAALGIGLPLLMAIAEGLWLRTGKQVYRDLARKWARATGLTFAIGAVSGTALSFERGLLWPHFMAFAGGIIGPAFALEGYAFFIEAIFLGLYLYGWDRLSPRVHWLSGIVVAISGMISGVLVVAANAWMQTPAGFTLQDGKAVQVSPFAPFLSPAWLQMALHSTLSAYAATSFAVAGVYAVGLLRGRNDTYHRVATLIAMAVGGVAAVIQPLSGDISARDVATHQPAKLAAMEALYHTQTHAPIVIGGIPDDTAGVVHFGIQLPGLLSFLVGHDVNTKVTGLYDIPREQWPNVPLVHFSFDAMVACAFALLGLSLWFWLAWWRGWERGRLWLLRAMVVASPLGYLALELGWVVAETGRQPWMIYQIMRTSQGVTPVGGVGFSFMGFSLIYTALGVTLIFLLRGLATGAPTTKEEASHVA
jgi:cytochrome bd ubiquinol oxidase subunit I